VRRLHPQRPGILAGLTRCGQPGRVQLGRCARCSVGQRLIELLSDARGEIRPDLQALYEALLTAKRPSTVAAWLDTSAAPAILRDLQAGNRPLTHQTLDDLPAGKTVEHLRAVLVAVGALPHRDEQMIRLERWIGRVIAQRPDTEQREPADNRYALWHVVHRLRRLPDTHATAVAAQQNIQVQVPYQWRNLATRSWRWVDIRESSSVAVLAWSAPPAVVTAAWDTAATESAIWSVRVEAAVTLRVISAVVAVCSSTAAAMVAWNPLSWPITSVISPIAWTASEVSP